MRPALRVLLDVNIWVSNLIATGRGRQGTAVQKIVSAVASGVWGRDGRAAQLVVSHEMLDTLADVLFRLGGQPTSVEAYSDAIRSIMTSGPEELDPYLLLGGREQYAMHDREDAGVLATAYASKTSLLVTDNLKDFETGDALRIDTRRVRSSSGERQLFALRYQGVDVDLIVAHPFDVTDWLDRGLDFDPPACWTYLSGLG